MKHLVEAKKFADKIAEMEKWNADAIELGMEFEKREFAYNIIERCYQQLGLLIGVYTADDFFNGTPFIGKEAKNKIQFELGLVLREPTAERETVELTEEQKNYYIDLF